MTDLPHDPEQLDDPLDALLDEPDDALARSLAQLLAPPADLETRTTEHVTTSLMSRSLLGTCSDLLSVGWQTLRLLVSPDPNHPEEVQP